MTRLRSLVAAWIAASFVLLGLAGPAWAFPSINGNHLDAWSNGAGQFNAEYDNAGSSFPFSGSRFFFDQSASQTAGAADAGLNVGLYNWDGGSSSKVFGFRGTPFVNTSTPAVTGTGADAAHPYVMTSKYTTPNCATAFRCLEVTETEQYVNSTKSLLVTYDVKNVSADPPGAPTNPDVNFRLTTGGDVFPGGDEGGRGRYITSGGRFIGTVNENRGAAMDLQESVAGGSPAWDHYMEAEPFAVWQRVQNPDGAGLNDLPTDAYNDKAAAVQWDNHAPSGTVLAFNQTAHYEVRWRFRDFDSLDVPANSDQETHTILHVPVAANNEDGSATNFGTSPLYWRTTPGAANPHLGSFLGTWNKVTSATGTADITYTGDNAGTDTIEFWVDTDNDGVRDTDEPYRTDSIYWFDRVQISYSEWDSPFTGYQNYVHLYTVNGSAQPEARQFRYYVKDKETNSVRIPVTPSTGSYTTSVLENGDYQNGVTTGIPLTRDTPGTDVVHVLTDVQGNLTFGDQPGEDVTYEVHWRSRVEVDPAISAYSNSTFESINSYSYTSDGDDNTSDVGFFVTDPGAGNPNAHIYDEPPVAADFGYNEFPISASDVGLSPSTGGTRLYHVYIDEDGNGSYDPGESVSIEQIDWLVSPTKRLSFDTNSGYGVIGQTKSLTVTVRNTSGAAAQGVHVHYYVTGSNPVPDTDAGTSAVDGKRTMQFNAAQAGFDTVHAWADFNGDGVPGGNEPLDSANISWGQPIRLSANDVRVPAQASASAIFVNANGDFVSPSLVTGCTYTVAPTHPVGSTACPAPLASSIPFQWPGSPTSVTGPDTLTVNATIPGIGPTSAMATVNFLDQIALNPTSTTKTVGQLVQIYPQIYNASDTGRSFHYVITGANPQSGDVTYPNPIQYTGAAAGDDTITVTTTAPAAQSTATVHWNPDTLTVTGTGDGTQGAGKTVTATYRDSVTGNPVQGTTLRWTISGDDAQYGKHAALTDVNGQVPISWPTTDFGNSYPSFDSVTVYADLNGNGSFDPGEPRKANIPITLHPSLEPDDIFDSKYQGDTKTITVTYRDLAFNPIAGHQLKYQVVDVVPGSAGNPVAPTNMPQLTNGSGQTSITLTGTNAGDERLKIWDDTTANGVIDPGEKVATTELVWTSRVDLNPEGTVNRQVTAGNLPIAGSLFTLGGNPQANATVKYKIAGLHATNGVQTVTTDQFGGFTLPDLPSTDGGQDVVTAWLDLNSNDVVDPGESKDVLTVNWTGAVNVTPGVQTLYMNGTHAPIAFSGGGIAPATGSLTVSYSGPNVGNRATSKVLTNWNGSSYPVPAITGGLPGTDVIHAWWDKDNDMVQDVGEPGTSAFVTWSPLVTLGNPTGSLEAGNPTTVTALLVDTSGNPVAGADRMKWKTTGANTNPATAIPGVTDGSGHVQAGYTAVNAGTDTLIVWRDLNLDGVVDPGEPQGSRSVQWIPPAVTLGIAPQNDRKFQGNVSNFTVTLGNMPGGNNGRTIRWSVSGANAGQTGTATTNGAGQATIAWTGVNDGTDTVSAYADVSGTTGARDGFDPVAETTIVWDPLVRITGGATEETIGATHSETIQFINELGAPLADNQVIYQIAGANPTSGQIVSRPVGSGAGARIHARTDANGNAIIAWVGTNGGTDTLDVWADRNGNGIVDAAEPHAQKIVTFAGAAAAGSGGGPGTGPTGSASAVPPGSPSDFDGLPAPPPPVVAKTVNVTPISGKVLVRLPGSKRFISLLDAEQIPVGSIVDVSKGRVALTSAQDLKGAVATAQFYLGVFQIAQKRAAKPVTDLKLFGGSFAACPKIARAGKSSLLAGAAKKRVAPKKQIRQLWGEGKGSFRTDGKYAAAAIRGTTWDVVDYCNGTLVKVTKGAVTVTDNVKHQNIALKAPKTYFAAAKR